MGENNKFNNSEWETASVQSHAGKSTGQYKYWWNVKVVGSGETKSLNTQGFEEVEKVPEDEGDTPEEEEALVVMVPRYLHDQPECAAAKEKELLNWEKF